LRGNLATPLLLCNIGIDQKCFCCCDRSQQITPLQGCRGFAPRYSEEARQSLRGSLTAARHILAETCGPMTDMRTGRDLVPEMLRGSRHPLVEGGTTHGAYDLTDFHTALLWAGSSIMAVGAPQNLGHD